MKQKTGIVVYIVLFWFLCLLPFAGMTVYRENNNSENRKLSEFPSLYSDEQWNWDWLSKAGDYFQDHFAFRNYIVTANALLQGKLLGTSTAQSVIQGIDGWLYYSDSLDDFLGRKLLSERSLYNISHSLAMFQQKLESQGIQFTFTIAPNKNSLYGEHMPYYDNYRIGSEKNLFRLKEFLEKEQVHYTDLYQRLSEENAILYHERDSHWNNKGAAIAADAILDSLKKIHENYENESFIERKDYIGDLDQMLYPKAVEIENEFYLDRAWSYQYIEAVESNFDPRIETIAEGKTGSLVMFRDSFANALLPYFADTYRMAFFSRGIPYQFQEIENRQADSVVIERAERFLPEMAQNPPLMAASAFRINSEAEELAEDGADHISMTEQGKLTRITGHLNEKLLDTHSRIFIKINQEEYLYEAFPADIKIDDEIHDSGFCIYINTDLISKSDNQITIYIIKDETLKTVCRTII